MCKSTVLLAAAFAFMFGPLAEAAMYKWVDEDGNVVYSEKKPPQGVAGQEIKKHGAGISDEEAQSQLDSLRDKADAAAEERDIKDEVAGQQAERSATIKKNCEIARKNKTLLETTARVTLKDEDGNDYFLEDEDRQNKLADAQAQVDRYCS